MKHVTTILLSAAAAIFIAGCTTYETPRTESISKAIDLNNLDTFTVRVNGATDGDTAFGPVARNEALEDIVEEFEERGFDYTDSSDADFVVVFTSTIQDESQPFVTNYSEPSRRVVTTEEQVVTPTGDVVTTDRSSRVITTRESTPIALEARQRLFVLDVVDTATNVLLWRGYVATDDVEIRDDEVVEEHIEQIIEQLPNMS